MHPSRCRLTRLAAEQLQAATACAAPGPSQPAAQGLSAALLRQLSSVSSALGAPHSQAADSEQAAAARQRRRSHSAAGTSGRPFNSSAPAAAQRSSSPVTPAPARTKSTMAPTMAAAMPAQQHAAVQQALQAAARLVRQADARREAALADLDRPLPCYEQLRGPCSRRRADPEDDGMTLKRAANFSGEAEEREPVWARAAAAQGAAPATESHAALALYRQEVLHGHDPEVALASSGAFVHVPFLRSGMFAAHQGYGLQSELSRVRLQSRVLGPQAALEAAAAADGEFAAAGRSSGSSSAIAGLQSVMEASRAVAGEAEEEARRGRGRPRTRPQDPPRPPKVSAKLFGTTPEQRSSQLPMLPGLTVAVATPEELKMCLGEDSKQVLRSDAAVMEEDLSEELVDAAAAQQDWEAHLAAAASGAAAAARAVGAGDSTLAPLSPSRNFQYEQLKPQPPAASCAAVLEALGQLEGVDVSGPDGIGESVSRLWRPFRTRARGGYPVPLLPVEPPTEPETCLQSMLAMARLLIEDLGVEAFSQVVRKAPWVLLLDGEMHGRPQLEALHVLEMEQERRAEFVLKHPRILQTDVEAGLLPTFEYLQSLGMSSEQMYRCLVADPTYSTPAALPRLKAVAAFWLGKGMSKPDLIQMIATWPKVTFGSSISERELKFDWLADHVGVTVEDVAAMPTIMHRSLLDTIGPRVGFLLSKGYKIQPPSQAKAGSAAELDDSCVPLGRLLNYGKPAFFNRFTAEPEEFEGFKADWLQADFPAWLEQRKPGIDYYRSLTGNRQQHSIKHIEEQRRQQQQEAREAFAAAELDYECAAFA